MDVHKKTLEQQVKDRSEKLAKILAKTERMNGFIQNLKETIDKQSMTTDDLVVVEAEIKGLVEAHDRAMKLVQQRSTDYSIAEKKLDTASNKLEDLVAEYNASLSRVQEGAGANMSCFTADRKRQRKARV